MSFLRLSCFLVFLAGIFSTLSGCANSSLGTVSGTVTLDGEPLAGAVVSFTPAQGRASAGKTKGDGSYTLRYIKSEMGAVIGEHVVTITVPAIVEETRGEVDYGPNGAVATARPVTRQIRSTLPKRYGNKETSELKATVTSGRNAIDFDLKSK